MHWFDSHAWATFYALGEHDKALNDDANCSDRILG